MARFLLKSELETELPLVPDEPRATLEEPTGRYTIHLENAPIERGDSARRVLAYLICEAGSLEAAHKVAREYLREFSETLTLLTSHRVRWKRDICLWEWFSRAPVLNGRIYSSVDVFGPELVAHIGTEVLDSFGDLSWDNIPREIRLARRWFATGIGAATSVESFQWFWLTIEVLAHRSEHVAPIQRTCKNCGEGIMCKLCGADVVRGPTASEVILAALSRHEHGLDDLDAFVKNCLAFRNTITHGGSLEECEQRQDAKLESVVDSAAHLAKSLLLSEYFEASDAESIELYMLEPHTFLKYRATFSGVVAFKPPQDRELELSDIPGLTATVTRRERERPIDPDSR